MLQFVKLGHRYINLAQIVDAVVLGEADGANPFTTTIRVRLAGVEDDTLRVEGADADELLAHLDICQAINQRPAHPAGGTSCCRT